MKLAFVIQRYGEEISGGAELHCRLIAERMVSALGYEIHVYTSCAVDYMTWENVYTPGIETLNGVIVHRFPVDAPRDVVTFNRISEEVFKLNSSLEREEEWMRSQGPYSTALFSALGREKNDYTWVLFYNYLYCTTYFGLPVCREKAILAPMAHDEPPIYLSIFKKIFETPQAIMFNTEEEQQFIQTQFAVETIPARVVGMWAPEPGPGAASDAFWKRVGSKNFIVYIGRVDASKGCEELISHFIRYKKEHASDLKLILMGKGDMKIPRHRDIVAWGYASDEEKWQALSNALASVVPSMYESLSISLLESFVVSRPVIVNGVSAVTVGHSRKSNGGLWYKNGDEFSAILEYLRTHPEMAHTMGVNGKAYVTERYNWSRVLQQYQEIFEELAKGNV